MPKKEACSRRVKPFTLDGRIEQRRAHARATAPARAASPPGTDATATALPGEGPPRRGREASPAPARRERPGERHAWLAEEKQQRRGGDQQAVLRHVRRQQGAAEPVERRDERDDDDGLRRARTEYVPAPDAAPQAGPRPEAAHAAPVCPACNKQQDHHQRVEVPSAPEGIGRHGIGAVRHDGPRPRHQGEKEHGSRAYRHQQDGEELPHDADGGDPAVADGDHHPETLVREIAVLPVAPDRMPTTTAVATTVSATSTARKVVWAPSPAAPSPSTQATAAPM